MAKAKTAKTAKTAKPGVPAFPSFAAGFREGNAVIATALQALAVIADDARTFLQDQGLGYVGPDREWRPATVASGGQPPAGDLVQAAQVVVPVGNTNVTVGLRFAYGDIGVGAGSHAEERLEYVVTVPAADRGIAATRSFVASDPAEASRVLGSVLARFLTRRPADASPEPAPAAPAAPEEVAGA